MTGSGLVRLLEAASDSAANRHSAPQLRGAVPEVAVFLSGGG